MRKIAVVTVGRSDYGILRPLLRAIDGQAECQLQLIVGGVHFDAASGETVREIREDGFQDSYDLKSCRTADTPLAIAVASGAALQEYAQAYDDLKPDLIVVLGDRFEAHAAVSAAVPFLIPVIHIGGGAVTYGAIDDGYRHAMTKLSHVHFVETDDYAARVIQMGENQDRVHVTGALGLDNLKDIDFLGLDGLNNRFGLALREKPVLVTFHPETRNFQQTEDHIDNLLNALDQIDLPVVFTYPNADTAGQCIITAINRFSEERRDRVFVVPHFGTEGYFSMMNEAAVMVGNSSSGIIESGSFRLPVVNIGKRQEGRAQGPNIVNCDHQTKDIVAGLEKALSPGFYSMIKDMENPYGKGNACQQMIDILLALPLDGSLIDKPFNREI